jgi:hypothetical protein
MLTVWKVQADRHVIFIPCYNISILTPFPIHKYSCLGIIHGDISHRESIGILVILLPKGIVVLTADFQPTFQTCLH